MQTDEVLISLDKMQGIEAVDAERGIVTVLAGTKLTRLGDELLKLGLAQENLGDINVQSIAGAISTGTHGTGSKFGSLATQIAGLTLVTASGEVLECSPEHNPDLFKAALVSLGLLGVIAKVKLRVIPAKILHYHSQGMKLADCLEYIEDYKQQNSHFEFYWFSYTDAVQAKFMNESDRQPDKTSIWGNFNKIVMENWVYWLLSEGCRSFPSLVKHVCNIWACSIANIDEVNYSSRLFSTPRMVRFQEMEYNIPAEHAVSAINAIQACIEQRQFKAHYPLECRFVHSDDIWLSPAYQRESCYIAVHMYSAINTDFLTDHSHTLFL